MTDRILRVFPRRTNATPEDDLSWIGDPGLFHVDCDEVHISVAFTYDRAEAERLKAAYEQLYPVVKIGGPGMGDRGGDFIPGLYLKPGYVITSRGCPNRCWFCDVWKREGPIRELPITEGWNVLDDNLLACSRGHIMRVFSMLRKQKQPVIFSGGLEASLIDDYIASELRRIKPKRIYTAFDIPEKGAYLLGAGYNLLNAGFTRSHLYCYVLIGYPTDTMDDAEERLRYAWECGFHPYAMLYQDGVLQQPREWFRFQTQWLKPYFVRSKCDKKKNADKYLRS